MALNVFELAKEAGCSVPKAKILWPDAPWPDGVMTVDEAMEKAGLKEGRVRQLFGFRGWNWEGRKYTQVTAEQFAELVERKRG